MTLMVLSTPKKVPQNNWKASNQRGMVRFKHVDFRKKSFSVVSLRSDFKDFFFNKYSGEKEM